MHYLILAKEEPYWVKSA